MQSSYDQAKELYFIHGKKKESLAFLYLLQGEAGVNAAKTAYFIAAIYLGKAMEKNRDSYAFLFSDSKAKNNFNKGLAWLKTAHDLGSEEASLLLGQIHAYRTTNHKIQVKVDEQIIGRFKDLSIYQERPFMENKSDDTKIASMPSAWYPDSGYASALLQTIPHNKEAAKLLSSFAFSYFQAINYAGNASYYGKSETGYRNNMAEEHLFFSSQDLEFRKTMMQQLALGPESPECIRYIESQADKRVFMAVKILYCYYAGYQKSLLIETDISKAVIYETTLWQMRYEACQIAIKWLENAINLGCDELSVSTTEQCDFVKNTFFRYAELRASGKSEEEVRKQLDLSSLSIPKDWQCGVCHQPESSDDEMMMKQIHWS